MRNLTWLALLFVACTGGDDTKSENEPVRPANAGPVGAVRAFIEAAAAKDAGALGKLMASNCEGEFKKLADGTASAGMLAELQEMFKGATAAKMTILGDKASVEVTLPNHKRGQETIDVVKQRDVWKVVGF